MTQPSLLQLGSDRLTVLALYRRVPPIDSAPARDNSLLALRSCLLFLCLSFVRGVAVTNLLMLPVMPAVRLLGSSVGVVVYRLLVRCLDYMIAHPGMRKDTVS